MLQRKPTQNVIICLVHMYKQIHRCIGFYCKLLLTSSQQYKFALSQTRPPARYLTNSWLPFVQVNFDLFSKLLMVIASCTIFSTLGQPVSAFTRFFHQGLTYIRYLLNINKKHLRYPKMPNPQGGSQVSGHVKSKVFLRLPLQKRFLYLDISIF